MFERVLLLSASAGAGHVRAAEALEKAFLEAGAAAEVRHVDVLEHTTKVFRDLYAKAYLELVGNAPRLLGWLYDVSDKPWKNERRRLAFDRLNTVYRDTYGNHLRLERIRLYETPNCWADAVRTAAAE